MQICVCCWFFNFKGKIDLFGTVEEYAADVHRVGVWIFILFSFKTDMDTLEPFFVLLRSFIQSCPNNQEALLRNDGIAALGVILQKVWETGKYYEDEKVYSLICSKQSLKLLLS